MFPPPLTSFSLISRVILDPGESGTSISVPDLTTADRKLWDSGFPPGVTVDELWLYRKRRPPVDLRPHDHLKIEEGTYKHIKSEYARSFRNYFAIGGSCGDIPSGRDSQGLLPLKMRKPSDTLKLEGLLELHPEYQDAFIQLPLEKPVRYKPLNSYPFVEDFDIDRNETARLSTEIQSQYVKYETADRSQACKRPNNLTLEGDFYSTTEQAEKFIKYILTGRPDLARKPTTLRLEGDMEKKTETTASYTYYDFQPRAPLCKRYTNLHLDGEQLVKMTDYKEQYVPYEYEQRAPFEKRQTNLHLSGEFDLLPEYRQAYKAYKVDRTQPKMPEDNIKTDEFFHPLKSTSITTAPKPQMPYYREREAVKVLEYPEDQEKKESFFSDRNRVEKLKVLSASRRERSQEKNEGKDKKEKSSEDLSDAEFDGSEKKQSDETKDVGKPDAQNSDEKTIEKQETDSLDQTQASSEATTPKKVEKAGRKDSKSTGSPKKNVNGKKIPNYKRPPAGKATVRSSPRKSVTSVQQSKFDHKPEYREAYVDHSKVDLKKSPTRRRNLHHASNIRSQDSSPEYRSSFAEYSKDKQAPRRPQGYIVAEPKIEPEVELTPGYVKQPFVPKQTKKMTEPRMEGPFECAPEYRKAYTDFLIRERIERKQRPLENIKEPPQRVFPDITPVDPTEVDRKKVFQSIFNPGANRQALNRKKILAGILQYGREGKPTEPEPAQTQAQASETPSEIQKNALQPAIKSDIAASKPDVSAAKLSEKTGSLLPASKQEQSAKPEPVKKPDSAQTKVAKPDSAQTKKSKPDSAQTKQSKPDSAQTKQSKPDSAQGKQVKPDSAQTKQTKPDSAQTKPDSAITKQTKPDSAQTKQSITESATVKPDSALTTHAKPDSGQTKTATPDSAKTQQSIQTTKPTKPESAQTTQAKPDSAQTIQTNPESASTHQTKPDSAQTKQTKPDIAQVKIAEAFKRNDSEITSKTESGSIKTDTGSVKTESASTKTEEQKSKEDTPSKIGSATAKPDSATSSVMSVLTRARATPPKSGVAKLGSAVKRQSAASSVIAALTKAKEKDKRPASKTSEKSDKPKSSAVGVFAALKAKKILSKSDKSDDKKTDSAASRMEAAVERSKMDSAASRALAAIKSAQSAKEAAARAEKARKEKEEKEKQAQKEKEEAEAKLAAEKAEAERIAKEEAERKAAEKAKKAEEERLKAEAEEKAKEEAARLAAEAEKAAAEAAEKAAKANRSLRTPASAIKKKYIEKKISVEERLYSPWTNKNASKLPPAPAPRVGQKFEAHVSVEDLAYVDPYYCPIVLPASIRDRKKPKEEAIEEIPGAAFVIVPSDQNNNESKSNISEGAYSLFKEQKWMTSW